MKVDQVKCRDRIFFIGIFFVLVTTAVSAQTRWPFQELENQISDSVRVFLEPCRNKTPRITSDSIGPLFLDQSLTQVESICDKLYYGWDWGDEGIPTPVVLARLGESVFEVEFSDTLSSATVVAISTRSAHARTKENIGVGSHFVELARKFGKPTFGVAECVLWAWFVKNPGLSYRLDLHGAWSCEQLEQFVAKPDATILPRSTVIKEVTISK